MQENVKISKIDKKQTIKKITDFYQKIATALYHIRYCGYLGNFKILSILPLTFNCAFPCALGLENLQKCFNVTTSSLSYQTLLSTLFSKQKEKQKMLETRNQKFLILVLYPSKM